MKQKKTIPKIFFLIKFTANVYLSTCINPSLSDIVIPVLRHSPDTVHRAITTLSSLLTL